jgi:hypothetical protein
MRGVAVLVLLWSTSALAEQPRGKYTLDRGPASYMTDAGGQPIPSCGGEKIFGGEATFVVEYSDKIIVNGRVWRFWAYAAAPGKKAAPDAMVIIADPGSKDTITIWFKADAGTASGILNVQGTRGGKRCVDAWILQGKFVR